MTASRCPGCGGPMPEPARTGRPRVWCSDACRWRAGHRRRTVPVTLDDLARASADLDAWLAGLS